MARLPAIGGNLFIGRALVEAAARSGAMMSSSCTAAAGTLFGTRVGEDRCDRNDVAAVRQALNDKKTRRRRRQCLRLGAR